MVSKRQLKVIWAMIVMGIVSSTFTVIGLIAWKHETDQRQKDFCTLLRVFDDPSLPPPSTDRARRQLEQYRAYEARDCRGVTTHKP